MSVTCDRSLFSMGTPVSSTNKTDRHDIASILLKVVLNTINQNTLAFLLLVLMKIFEIFPWKSILIFGQVFGNQRPWCLNLSKLESTYHNNEVCHFLTFSPLQSVYVNLLTQGIVSDRSMGLYFLSLNLHITMMIHVICNTCSILITVLKKMIFFTFIIFHSKLNFGSQRIEPYRTWGYSSIQDKHNWCHIQLYLNLHIPMMLHSIYCDTSITGSWEERV